MSVDEYMAGFRLVVEFTLEQQKMLDLRALEVAYRLYDKGHQDKLALTVLSAMHPFLR